MGRLNRGGLSPGVVAIVAPCALLAAAWMTAIVFAAAGRDPIWQFEPRNPAEAAATRDGGAIVRMKWAGASLDQPYDVRPEILWRESRRVPALVAAAAAQRTEIIELLIDLGAAPDAATWNAAWCASEDDRVREALAMRRPSGSSALACAGGSEERGGTGR